MNTHYFHRVTKLSPTRFWVNNPTRQQADLAIAAGAVGCTNNPSYSQKMIDHPGEGSYASRSLDDSINETNSTNDAVVLFQRKLVKPIAEKFLPLYRQSNGRQGYGASRVTQSTRKTLKKSCARQGVTSRSVRTSAAKSRQPGQVWPPWKL